MTLLDGWMEEAAKHLRVPLRDGHICDCEHDGGIHDDLPRALAILRAAAALAETARAMCVVGAPHYRSWDAMEKALAAFDEAVKEET